MSLSTLEMSHPSYLECLLRIFLIVLGVSPLVEVGDFGFGVLVVVLVYPPLEVGYTPLEVVWSSLAIVVLDGIQCDFYVIGALLLTSCRFPDMWDLL